MNQKNSEIVLVTHDLQGDPFWLALCQGAAEAAASFNLRLCHLRPSKYSLTAMQAVLQQALERAPDGLLTTLPEPQRLEAPLRTAITAGLPVILINTLDRRPVNERLPVLCSIGADDYAGGLLAAEKLLASGSGGSVLCIDHYHVANTCHGQRITGLQQGIHASGGSVEVLHVDADRQSAAQRIVAAAIHSKNPRHEAVLSLGPPGWALVDQVLESLTENLRPCHVSFDLSGDLLDSIAIRRTLGLIDCQQYLQGYLGVIAMQTYLSRGYVPTGEILTGPRFIDKDSPHLRQRLEREACL